MLPKSGLTWLFFVSLIGVSAPVQAATATSYGESDIAQAESKLFAHPYPFETLPARVSRVERFVYGEENSGTLQNRMTHLFDSLHANDVLSNKPQVVAQARETKSVTTSTARAAAGLQQAVRYPRVTEIEQQILEQTFENEPVASRLSRLEGKVFGRAWQEGDLAIRTDRLAEYAYTSPKVAELERQELLRVSMLPRANKVSKASMITKLHALPGVDALLRTPERSVQAAKPVSVVDEIESLETMAFGKISASKPLARRVDALEVSFCGAAQSDKQQNLTSRVALLMSKVNNWNNNRLGV